MSTRRRKRKLLLCRAVLVVGCGPIALVVRNSTCLANPPTNLQSIELITIKPLFLYH